ncbi:MAG: hypothetical protein C0443_04030 [Comamonadaceae bacterium]|nr:hypothetical protein [Comamonadaceae bacterium]
MDATEMDSGRLRSHLDRLQRRQRLQADTALLVRAHQRELRHWQDQLLRQSALLLIEHTRAAWGLVPGLSAQPWPPTPAAAPWAAGQLPQAHAVICRTGCALDHDHWRDGDQCRRTGQACDRRPDGGGA